MRKVRDAGKCNEKKNVSLAPLVSKWDHKNPMGPKTSDKRLITVSVRMQQSDLDLINRAAKVKWKDARGMTQSAIVRDFAYLYAKQALEEDPQKQSQA